MKLARDKPRRGLWWRIVELVRSKNAPGRTRIFRTAATTMRRTTVGAVIIILSSLPPSLPPVTAHSNLTILHNGDPKVTLLLLLSAAEVRERSTSGIRDGEGE